MFPWRGAHAALLPVLLAVGGAACAPDAEGDRADDVAVDPQLAFWESLAVLCGEAFEGSVTESQPPDPSFEGQQIIMHVRSCEAGEIRVPFVVGEDRSRTWVLTTTAVGLRLEHDHRHEDGTEDAISRYGGDARGRGTASLQEFPADARTARLVPEAATNVWSLEIHPNQSFAYALRRGGSDRRFRVEFDLTQPVPAPPPPWGR